MSATTTVYGSHWATVDLPEKAMNDGEMAPSVAYKLICDELLLDGTPALNLASFVSTSMEDEAEKLMLNNLSKNFIDCEEYPALASIEKRCVSLIGELFHTPRDDKGDVLGVSCIGSSEAIILSVLAAKRRWVNMRKAAGKPYDRPNLVMSSAVQVCWEKAVRYLEVEEKYWYTSPGKYAADPKELVDLVDENTILVCAILGITYNGEYEDAKKIDELLQAKNKAEGLSVGMHIDAASGGFVAPFVKPDLIWDFRLPSVVSINTSGHKYGLAYAGVGWAFWRGKECLPDELVFKINYLGSPQTSFTLNFSKSGVQVIGQFYQLLRLGKSGYKAIMSNITTTADFLADAIIGMKDGKLFELMSATNGNGLPLVAWRLKTEQRFDEFAIARGLRSKGWIVPAYTMAPKCDELKMMRIVIRSDFSRQRADTFLRDLSAVIDDLEATPDAVLQHSSKQKKEPSKHWGALQKAFAEHTLSDKHEQPKPKEGDGPMGGQKANHGVC